LGDVTGTLHLPHPPAPDFGLNIYLIPHDVPPEKWADAKPTHRLQDRYRPFRKVAMPKDIPFVIRGVTPGKYWVKAVFDDAAPTHDSQDIYRGEAGDFESAPQPPFEVRVGEVTSAGDVTCITPIAR
jgi:hypothetical protein